MKSSGHFCVRCIEFAYFVDLSIVFWECSDNVVFLWFLFHFLATPYFFNYNLHMNCVQSVFVLKISDLLNGSEYVP